MRLLAALIVVFAAISVLVPCVASARDWPAPTGYVNDYAKIIDAASADSIEALGKELQEKTGAEMAVVTLPDLGGEEIEPAATELFSRWGIGGKKKDDGVLILLALKERRVRIETGYGIEGIIPDGRAGGIIRLVMGPDLSADRFGIGLLKGARAVGAAIAAEHGVTLSGSAGVEAPPKDDGLRIPSWVVMLLFFMIFTALRSIFSARRGRRGWLGRGGGWYGPGGFGGMGGLGGFGGGFGGGSSGGGGASGRF